MWHHARHTADADHARQYDCTAADREESLTGGGQLTGLPLSKGVSSVNNTDDSGKIKSHGDFFLSSPNRKRLTTSLLGTKSLEDLMAFQFALCFKPLKPNLNKKT